jgi:acyl CoA:acetate/3-ketoacid CoA transferase beta subunit
MSYSFGQLYNGYVDKAFLGYAQIDMYGNVNTHMIGGDFHNYKNRLTGSGGNNDLSSLAKTLVLVGLQSPQKFVKNVDFITSPGYLTGGNSRKESGLVGGGPMAVITSAGTYDFEPESKRMRINSLHPGVSPELAQLASGFELLKPAGEIPVTPVPTQDIINILRREVDPRGVFTSMPS